MHLSAIHHVYLHIGSNTTFRQQLSREHRHGQRPSDDAIHCALSERVQPSILAPHELRFEEVAAAAAVLKGAEVELHGQVQGLVVQRHQLAAGVPEHL